MKVLGISSSPRIKSSTDLLLRRALAGAESAGAQTEYLRLADFKIAPCVECNACYKLGKCRINDDYQQIFPKMLETDRLIFATPIFFMAVCAQAKLLIDRCQSLWACKYILKQPLIEAAGRDRRAMVIAVGGSKSTKMFECIRLTMKYFFDVLDIRYVSSLFMNNIENPGDIAAHPCALNEAFRLGAELAAAPVPPGKPIEVQLL